MKRKMKLIAMILCIMLMVFSAMTALPGRFGGSSVVRAATFSGGTGTSADPYIITTAAQLDAVRNDLSASYKLGANIDLSAYLSSSGAGYNGGNGWAPIGTINDPFDSTNHEFIGTFDGGGYVIRNLTSNSSVQYVGLFGWSYGTIKNVGLTSVNISSHGLHVGGLAGDNQGTITNAYVTGSVISTTTRSRSLIGGLVGRNLGHISNAYVTGSVSVGSSHYVGGLVGYNGGTITNSYATGSVSGGSYVGGLVGYNGASAVNSYTNNPLGYNSAATLKSLSDMKKQSTYSGWDFTNTWGIQSGSTTPYLLAFKPSLTVDSLASTKVNFSSGPLAVTGSVYAGNIGEPITIAYDIQNSSNASVTSATYNVNATGGAQSIDHTISLSGLPTGSYTLHVTATNPNGTAVNATPQSFSIEPTLSSLNVSQGTLSPTFTSGTTSYTDSVDNSVSSITVTPTVADTGDTVTMSVYDSSNTLVSGPTALTSGTASSSIPLHVGDTTMKTVVTSKDGTTSQTYSVTVTRAQSSNADLNGLSLSQGTLSPTFASGTTSYTASVANSVSSIDITPKVADSTATVTVNGSAATSGSPSSVPLSVGLNSIPVVVTAQDGTKKTYTVTVTRDKSGNADLSGLSISQGMLSLTFASGTTSYTASVAHSVSSIDITPTVADSTATVTVNGSVATSGSASTVTLNVGSNAIPVVVTAQDGTKKTYTVTVTRAAPSSNADLNGLSISQGTLSPSFTSGTASYTASVTHAVYSIKVTPTIADSSATVTMSVYDSSNNLISGPTTLTSGTASPAISLQTGTNTVQLLVTAQDGTTKTYQVTITRVSPPSGSPAPVTIENNQNGGVTLTANSPVIKTVSRPDGTVVEQVNIDSNLLNQALNKLNHGSTHHLTIKVNNTEGTVQVELPASSIVSAAKSAPDTIIEVQTNGSSYQLEVQALDLEKVAKKLGVNLKDLKVNVTIEKVDSKTETGIQQLATHQGLHLASSIIDFKVTVEANGHRKEITDFGGTYMARSIVPKAGYNGKNIIGVIYDPITKTFRFVPSQTDTRADGKPEMTMNVPHNSMYAVVEVQLKTFADLNGHWAQKDVELLASKLIVNGVAKDQFAPNKEITRAEFTALLVRSLGLAITPNEAKNGTSNGTQTTSQFTDVSPKKWYAPAVAAAVKAGIINGYADGTFKPNQPISREEISVLIDRAKHFIDKKQDQADVTNVLSHFTDQSDMAKWSKKSIANLVEEGLVNGRSTNQFAPKAHTTRAEAAVLLARLLKQLHFIN